MEHCLISKSSEFYFTPNLVSNHSFTNNMVTWAANEADVVVRAVGGWWRCLPQVQPCAMQIVFNHRNAGSVAQLCEHAKTGLFFYVVGFAPSTSASPKWGGKHLDAAWSGLFWKHWLLGSITRYWCQDSCNWNTSVQLSVWLSFCMCVLLAGNRACCCLQALTSPGMQT